MKPGSRTLQAIGAIRHRSDYIRFSTIAAGC